MDELTLDFGDDEAASPPAGLCECGCGRPAPIAQETRKNRGMVKGQPMRFLKGHGGRVNSRAPKVDLTPSPEKGLCECGCGLPAPIARQTNNKLGYTRGQAQRFIRGHGNKGKPSPHRLPISQEVRLCECGCGQPTTPAKHTDRRLGIVRGQPNQFIKGHASTREVAQRFAWPPDREVPPGVKLCECGCGLPAPISPSNDPRRGYVKGEARRFIQGHRPVLPVEVGERYGRGVVVETGFRISPPGHSNESVRAARLICDCGREYVRTVYVIRTGVVKSCGCLLRSKGGDTPELVARNCVLNDYQQSAQDRGIAWELSTEDFTRLILMDCFYCGGTPQMRVRSKRYPLAYNGLDRVDSRGVYALENVVTACGQCNRSKNDLSFDEFMKWVARLTEYQWFHPDLMSSAMLRAAGQKPLLQVVRDTGTDG